MEEGSRKQVRLAGLQDDGQLAITSPGVQAFDAVTATRLAADANDVLAAAVKAHPTRFAGLAAVAPHYPEGAAKVSSNRR